MKRDIITIDEEKCTGCGLCVLGCHEGALQMIDGKARLVNELFCDGLGACIGDCPEGAITVEHKEAAPYDELLTIETLLQKSDATVVAHLMHLYQHNAMDFYKQGIDYLKEKKRFDLITAIGQKIENSEKKGCRDFVGSVDVDSNQAKSDSHSGCGCAGSAEHDLKQVKIEQHSGCGCAGSAEHDLSKDRGEQPQAYRKPEPKRQMSELVHWPVQLHLVSPMAPFFSVPELVVMSTCGPIASANVHADYIAGRAVVVACPKLDKVDPYREKLGAIMQNPKMQKVIVVRMEVPCCGGLTAMVKDGRDLSGRTDLIIEEHTLNLQGELISMNRK